ncbi:MAG TPA: DUF4199 domain-containing protein [Cyclobacteriaceae bacterium]|jgi:hypothetical protein|nr:DUF4199 domain-containing protein [Cyclobacteriaceae bacterium]
MEENQGQPTLVNHAVKWGLIAAGVSIVLTILCYVIDYTLMVQLKFALLSLAIFIGIVIYAGIDYRNSQGGFLSYGKAFQHGFLIMAVSGLVGTLFGMLLYNVIDAELPQKLVDASLDNTREMLEKFGVPDDKMDEALEKAKADTASRFTIFGQIKGYLILLIIVAVISLITSLFTRKNQPVEV